jgi:oligopeptide transport system permease protein
MTSLANGWRQVDLRERRATGAWGLTFDRLRHDPMAIAGATIVAVLVVVGLVGPMLVPWQFWQQDIPALMANGGRALPPLSPNHLLGTDQIGRDVLSRVLNGAQVSLAVAAIVQVVVLVIGLPIGALAGWFGGWVDTALMRFTDVMYAFPDLLFVIMVTVAFLYTPMGGWLDGLFVVFAAIGLISWVTMARLVRAQVMTIKHRDYIDAARASGASDLRIVTRHVLPNAIGPIVVAISIGLPNAILVESTLSFLGLGVQVPRPSWGSLMNFGMPLAAQYPWMLVAPMVAVALALIGFTLLGEAVRDALQPGSRERTVSLES